MKIKIILTTVLLTVGGCSEVTPITATYDVYFWFPDSEKQQFLGTTHGISQCRETASNFAIQKELKWDSGWSYVCCMKVGDNNCVSKHK